MRIAKEGEVWEWCSWDSNINGVSWEPVLLLECLGVSIHDEAKERGLHDWIAIDLFTGEMYTVFNVPGMGWELVE